MSIRILISFKLWFRISILVFQNTSWTQSILKMSNSTPFPATVDPSTEVLAQRRQECDELLKLPSQYEPGKWCCYMFATKFILITMFQDCLRKPYDALTWSLFISSCHTRCQFMGNDFLEGEDMKFNVRHMKNRTHILPQTCHKQLK